MKTTKTILLGAFFIGMLYSCVNINTVNPSNIITTQNRTVENYDGLEISSAFAVDVQYSATNESIEIEANENLHKYIVVEKVNGLLQIHLRNGVSITGNSTLKAHIITNNILDYYSASGASIIFLKDPSIADEVTINLSGASHFSGSITANSVNVHIEGASNVSFQGSTESLQVIASGASTVSDYDMVAQHANINLSGASQANFTIDRTISVSVSGASILRYKGSGVITDINVSDASQVIKMN